MRTPRLIAFVLLFASAGCTKIDGYTLNKRAWKKDKKTVLDRAAFDMSCPREKIKLTVLDEEKNYARQIGAEGCGKKGAC